MRDRLAGIHVLVEHVTTDRDHPTVPELGSDSNIFVTHPVLVAKLASMDTETGSQAYIGRARSVKLQNGATYTVTKRSRPRPGQRSFYWLGDNGQEFELTEQEAAELL